MSETHGLYGSYIPTTWAKARTYGIGGSDAPTVLGLNPWCSPFTLWKRKAGLLPEIEQTTAMEWGHRLEDVIAAYYAEQTGMRITVANTHVKARLSRNATIERYDDGALFRSNTRPWQLASVDRLVECPSRGWGVLEIKNVGERLREKWKDGVPDYVRAQNLHYQQVLGLEWGAVAVLFGGRDPGFMDVVAAPEEMDALLAAETAFWQSLVEGEPPPADGSESTRDAIAKLYPGPRGGAIALSDEALEWDREYERHKALEKLHTRKARGYETLIRAEMRDSNVAILASGVRWTSSTIAPSEVEAHTRAGYRRYYRTPAKAKR